MPLHVATDLAYTLSGAAFTLASLSLFLRFAPMAEGSLRDDLLSLATADGVAVRDVLVADASRRTSALNAYVSGLGRTRRIVVHDTLLDRGTEARLTCDHGSNLRLGLQGRVAIPDAGELTETGAFGNLPCGEGFIAPATAEGVLVVDGSIAGVGLVDEPVRLTIKDGHLVDATGEAGAKLMELLTVHGPDGTNVAELGIGTNEKAILTGNILEDEKILGTAHIAFGASAAIGGNVQVPVHLDVVSMRPEVTIDGTPVVLEGRLLV